jgi:hypothetical protein
MKVHILKPVPEFHLRKGDIVEVQTRLGRALARLGIVEILVSPDDRLPQKAKAERAVAGKVERAVMNE